MDDHVNKCKKKKLKKKNLKIESQNLRNLKLIVC